MTKRQMKYYTVIAVALLSLLLAIPVTHASAQPPIKAQSKTVKIALKPAPILPKPVDPPPVAKVAVPAPTPITAPPPPAPVKAIYTAYNSSDTCAQYANLFEQYAWNVDTAIAICEAESSGIATRINTQNWDGVYDYGLMQLHGVDILDPAQNISYAYYHKYLQSGWGPWVTWQKGIYLKYL